VTDGASQNRAHSPISRDRFSNASLRLDGFAARQHPEYLAAIYDLAAEYGTKEEVIRIAKVARYRPFITRLTPATISRIDAEDTRPPSL
jgi:hypothetical protein